MPIANGRYGGPHSASHVFAWTNAVIGRVSREVVANAAAEQGGGSPCTF